jgi:hypothetical protein
LGVLRLARRRDRGAATQIGAGVPRTARFSSGCAAALSWLAGKSANKSARGSSSAAASAASSALSEASSASRLASSVGTS